jgi:hypothetical protein
MQWPVAAVSQYQPYFQSITDQLVSRTLGLKCASSSSAIDDCEWTIEDWLLLTLLLIEGMLLSGLVVRLVKRRCLS